MNFIYNMPTKIFFQRNAIKNNGHLLKNYGKKALIVTGKHSSKINGSLNDVINTLKKNNIDYVIFDEVEENPSLETVELGRNIGIKENIDFIIGVGGGSPLDCAKAIGVFIKNPEVTKDNIFSQGQLSSLPVIAVATTSGTGSEVTQYSIVTVHKDKTKKNLGQSVFPEIAFLDSKYTFDLSYDITVNTAIDAFTHLVEGYLNTNANILSDIYAEKGFELFKDCFPKLINKNLDEDLRDKLMLASTLGGIQIAQNGTSLPHGMGYALTYFKNVPHGIANGILTIEYLRTFKNKTKINKMLTLLGMSSIDELEEIFNSLINIAIDISLDEIVEYSKAMVSNKAKLKNHPESVSLEDVMRIYSKSLL